VEGVRKEADLRKGDRKGGFSPGFAPASQVDRNAPFREWVPAHFQAPALQQSQQQVHQQVHQQQQQQQQQQQLSQQKVHQLAQQQALFARQAAMAHATQAAGHQADRQQNSISGTR
jgi:hypothetical protein